MKNYLKQLIKLSTFALAFHGGTQLYAVNAPTIKSEGVELAINEAVIVDEQSLTLMVPAVGDPENVRWVKNNSTLGYGFSLDVENFSRSKSGVYTLIQYLPNCKTIETNFTLNYLSLGEDLDECGWQTIDFVLPEGPHYTWSTGGTTNSFTATINESVTIAVSAVTEFGYVVKDEKVIVIESDCLSKSEHSQKGHC